MCSLKKEVVKQEEKAEFFEDHITQLTEDIQRKSKCVPAWNNIIASYMHIIILSHSHVSYQTFSYFCRIIQNFIMRERSGALAPPSSDENRLRQVKKGGVMGTVFSGKNVHNHRAPELNFELSLEMNRKMQSVLEDTLLTNITLKVTSQFLCVLLVVLHI